MSKFRVLLSEHLLNIRGILPFLIFFQLVVPTSLIFGLSHYAGSTPGNEQVLNVVSGSITFTMLFWGLSSLASKICNMRQQGTLLYYMALPVDKLSFISSLLLARLVILIPAFVVPLLVGVLLYDLKLNLSLWLIVIVILGAFTLATLGAALGSLIKDEDLLSSLTGAIIFIAVLLAPTFFPLSLLPLPLQLLGWLMPTTYVSDALRHSLVGNYEGSFYLDLGVLVAMAVLAGFLVKKFLVWRTL